MIHIDGSAQSGSGTILRYGVSLASLLGKEIEITNIRAKRAKPGLRPQHLTSVMACKQMTQGEVEGAEVGSGRIVFRPTSKIKGGDYRWDIGTAGSTTMLAMTILPLAIFADRPSTFRIEGGLFQDQAPSAFHMRDVLFSILKRMGIETAFKLIRPGYVPKGGGMIEVKVNPIIPFRHHQEVFRIQAVGGVPTSGSRLWVPQSGSRKVGPAKRVPQSGSSTSKRVPRGVK